MNPEYWETWVMAHQDTIESQSETSITTLYTTAERRLSGDNSPRFHRREDNFRPQKLVLERHKKQKTVTEEDASRVREAHPIMPCAYPLGWGLKPPIFEQLYFTIEPLNSAGMTEKDPQVGFRSEEEGVTVFKAIPRTERDILGEVQQMDGKKFPLHEKVVNTPAGKVLRPETPRHHKGKEVA